MPTNRRRRSAQAQKRYGYEGPSLYGETTFLKHARREHEKLEMEEKPISERIELARGAIKGVLAGLYITEDQLNEVRVPPSEQPDPDDL